MRLSDMNTVIINRLQSMSKQLGIDFSKIRFLEQGNGKIGVILGENSFTIDYNPDADTYNLNTQNLIKNNIYLDQVVDLIH